VPRRRLDADSCGESTRLDPRGGAAPAAEAAAARGAARRDPDLRRRRGDGSGYPAGLRGDAVPLPGRICAVFDALLSQRPYKDPWPLEDALMELRRERGRHFDPVVLDAFLAIVDDLDPALLATSEPVSGARRTGPDAGGMPSVSSRDSSTASMMRSRRQGGERDGRPGHDVCR
jgi:hypothetical protein